MASMDIDSPTTPMMQITPVVAEDNDETPISVEQPEQSNKRRRKKSIVWEHFTIETVDPGCMRACCKQCKKSFAYITGSKLAGTSHLKRHIALGICPVSRQKNEANQFVSGVKSDPPKRRYRTSPALGSISFDQDRCNQDVAKMIIQHEYPLHIVEHPAFVDFVRTLQPQYNMVSFNTIQGECVALYLREKQGLLNLISGIPGRVNISLDLRTSNLNVGYAFLTGHFIDTDWNLHRRILNVVMLPFPESEYAFNQAVISCISDWHLERRLFTLTLDQSVSNDNIIGNLRGVLSVKNQLMFNGQLVKGNCYARVLSRLAQDALGATGEVVRRIRESVKYVKTSDTHDEKFSELRQRLQVPSTRELIIDDQTKWDTTYQMLVAACELKEVFSCLDTTDPFYKINPSMDDWKQVEILCTYLKLFYDAASILTGPMCPPANAFYHEVSKIQLELTHAAMSQDPFVSNLARPLKERFDQYWRDCFLVLAIAIVMDPRFKMKLVEFSFSRIFGEEAGMWIKIVDDGIHELFLDYLPPNLSMPTTYMQAGNTNISHSDIFREATHQEVAPQELGFQGLEVMHHADVVAQGVDSQGATIEELQHEEVTLPEQPKEELPQDPSPEVMNHHEVAQEMHIEEAPHQEVFQGHEVMHHSDVADQGVDSQGATIEELQSEEVPPLKQPEEELMQDPSPKEDKQEVANEMDSQEAATQNMNSQGGATQEMNNQVAATQEMNGQVAATQEMGSEEVPKEMDSQEAPEQQMVTQDVPMEEMQHTAEILEQEKHFEGGPMEENDKKEVSPEEVPAEGRVPTEGIQAQEMTEEMTHEVRAQPEEVLAEGRVPTEGIQAEEMTEQMTHELQAQHETTPDMHAGEAPRPEVAPQEITLQGLEVMHHTDVAAKGVDSQGATIEELKPEEVTPLEQPKEELLQDPSPEEESQEVPKEDSQEVAKDDSEEAATHEKNSQEAGATQEMNYQAGATQEMNNQVAATQDMGSEEVPKEMDSQEGAAATQEMNNQAGATQEINNQVAATQEMNGQVAATQEINSEEVPKEMDSQEAPEQQMVNEDVTMQDMQRTAEIPEQEKHVEGGPMEEDDNKEVSPEEVLAEGRVPTEGIHTQEMTEEVTHEVQGQDEKTPDMHAGEAPPHPEVAPQEIGFQGIEAMDHADVQGVDSQGATIEELQPEEITPLEQPKEELQQDPSPEVTNHHEVAQEEMDSQEVARQDMGSQEGATQEINSQVAATQVAATQEMDSEEVPKHMDSHEAPEQQMVIQDVTMQEMEHTAEMSVQEKHVEGGHTEENDNKEVSPEGSFPTEGIQAQEMQHQVNMTHEMQARDEIAPDMHAQVKMTSERDVQEKPNPEMLSEGMHAQEMDYQTMSHEMHTQDLPLLSIGDGLQDFEVYISEIANSQHLKSELDQYLEESLLPRVQDFDVLGWWKLNKLKYPTLSKMAADILSIPVSTVDPESVFDIRSKKIDSYQSSLRPVTLEALVCAKDWLRYGSSASSSDAISNALVKMEY